MKSFVGQPYVIKTLDTHLEASQLRGEIPSHMLFIGPPGLGKTYLASLVAKQLGYELIITSGRLLTSYASLKDLIPWDPEPKILFIDEIHGMHIEAEEGLFSLMQEGYFTEDKEFFEDAPLQIVTIGTTTEAGLLSKPLRDRFTYIFRFQPYSLDDLETIIKPICSELSSEIAKRSFGTPRTAKQLSKQCRDFIDAGEPIGEEIFKALRIDPWGLNDDDRLVLQTLVNAQRLSLDSLEAQTNISKTTIYSEIEPRLLQKGLIERSARGRTPNSKAILEYIKILKSKGWELPF